MYQIVLSAVEYSFLQDTTLKLTITKNKKGLQYIVFISFTEFKYESTKPDDCGGKKKMYSW